MKKIYIKIAAFALFAAIITACTGKFEEINTDPDAYATAPFTNMLGNVLRNTAETMGGDMDGYGTFAGYISKIQYPDYLNGLIPSNNTYGNRWNACYYNNTQMKDLLEKSEENAEGFKNIRFVARIWQNYMWLYLTDGWRDVPFTEALKGSEAEGSLIHAKYDKQEDIYPAVMANLKAIADEMAAGFGNDNIGVGDFIYKGDVKKWQKFCNSLRLRMAIHISAVAPDLSKSTIEEICGNPGKYPFIDDNASSCYFWWQGTAPYMERWYNNFYTGRDDHGLFDIFVDHLKETKDPRIHSIMRPAEEGGEYVGYPNGGPTPSNLKELSRIGTMYRYDPAGFTPFFKSCESYYIIAEAAMLGFNVGMSAQDAYEKAVRLSMEDNKISTEEADAFLAGAGKWDNTKDRIWWDMWVGLFKDNFEAWCLYRRTGIPSTNYPSLLSIFGTDHNDQPFRLPYSDNQYLNNTKMLEEVVGKDGKGGNVVDHAWGQQMWWDTRDNVK